MPFAGAPTHALPFAAALTHTLAWPSPHTGPALPAARLNYWDGISPTIDYMVNEQRPPDWRPTRREARVHEFGDMRTLPNQSVDSCGFHLVCACRQSSNIQFA